MNGHKLELTGPGSGSSGTETIGLQLLKGSEVLIKNGTIVFTDDPRLKMGIQNYSNLTLDKVKISGGNNITYVVSNNFGNVVFKNHTLISADPARITFDAYYGMNAVYDDGVNVVIADNSVIIDGKVEFGKAGRASIENFADRAYIQCPADMELDVKSITPNCDWVDGPSAGTKTFKYIASESFDTDDSEP